jgi:hypothetical protein
MCHDPPTNDLSTPPYTVRGTEADPEESARLRMQPATKSMSATCQLGRHG